MENKEQMQTEKTKKKLIVVSVSPSVHRELQRRKRNSIHKNMNGVIREMLAQSRAFAQ
jgi:hypothetical protein